MGKYHNQITCRGDIRFDSKREAERYDELMLLERAGKIRCLKLQPEFTLQEAFKDKTTGERVPAIHYRADFSYKRCTEPDCNGEFYWIPVVEDVKGVRTKDYLIKKKMMLERGIRITEV